MPVWYKVESYGGGPWIVELPGSYWSLGMSVGEGHLGCWLVQEGPGHCGQQHSLGRRSWSWACLFVCLRGSLNVFGGGQCSVEWQAGLSPGSSLEVLWRCTNTELWAETNSSSIQLLLVGSFYHSDRGKRGHVGVMLLHSQRYICCLWCVRAAGCSWFVRILLFLKRCFKTAST